MRETVLFEKAIPKFEKVIPNIDGIPVKINKGYADLVKEKGYVFSELHIHNDIELLYVHEGHLGTKLADGSVYYCNDGDIICINSNVAHSTFASEDTHIRYSLMQFKSDVFKKKDLDDKFSFLSVLSRHKGMPVYISSDPELRQLCDNTFRWANEKDTAKNLFIASGIYGVLAVLYERGFIADTLSNVDSAKFKKLLPALEYISQKYKEDISLSEVAQVLNMSNFYFCRIFKETLEMGFTDYLNYLRIYKAQEQLINTEKSILEIAFENGFSSVSYFNRVFKATNCCSPSEYRKFCKESSKISSFNE